MVRVAQMHYREQLTQAQIGEQLGISRFQVGRLLDRGAPRRGSCGSISSTRWRADRPRRCAHGRFGLTDAVVVDAPGVRLGARQHRSWLARPSQRCRRAACGAAALWVDRRLLGAHDARARPRASPGWTMATEIVQLNGATSSSALPTRANEIAERFAATTGASIRLLAAPAIVGGPITVALEEDRVSATPSRRRAAPALRCSASGS